MNQQPSLESVARAYCSSHRLMFRQKVGEGAFKETFEAVQLDGTSVALKLYKPGSSSKRGSREIEAMQKCHHPSVARLVTVENFVLGGSEFIVIIEEFLSGGTLTLRGQIDVGSCFSLGEQLIDAVAHIANAGLVHRDLKPDNIMFRSDQTTPVIVDFGVVRSLSDTSLTPSWAPRGPGTPFFASPEQLNNEKHQIDWRSDQFSLGVVLTMAVTGEHPFQLPGLQPGQIVDRVAARESVNPQFPIRMQGLGLPVLLGMVEPWSVQRYRTPGQLHEAWRRQRS